MNLKKIALEKYIEFSQYEGSQHIAKEHSVYRILQLLKNEKAKNVLEVGLGIGTIYSAVRKYDKNITYFGTENNVFCLKSLKINLSGDYNSLVIYNSIEGVSFNNKLDVVIVDGKDKSFNSVKKIIKTNGVIIIEGDRNDQQEEVRKLFPNSKDVHIISLKKNSSAGFFDSNHYQGGVKIIYINPTTKQNINWIAQKISTKLKYIIRIIRK
jgi:protein-L-isoaspartate O-methyltransferase